MPEPEEHLYALPLEEFTPARDAAAREFRRAGDRDTAGRIAKLPKPSPAAWTANQVAREQPELVEALLEAGAALREAQDAAVAGHGARGLREATVAMRAAVEAVMAEATTLRPAGRTLSRAMADRLRATLHAAAGDETVREALAAGRLVSEAQAGGAWPFAVGEPAAGEERAAKPRAPQKARGAAKPRGRARTGESERAEAGQQERAEAGQQERAEAGEQERAEAGEQERAEAGERERLEAEQREREAAERRALEAQLRDARGALRVRERVAAGAQEDTEAAARALDDTRERLAAAQQAVADAEAEAESAERVATEAREAVGEARDAVARLEERLD